MFLNHEFIRVFLCHVACMSIFILLFCKKRLLHKLKINVCITCRYYLTKKSKTIDLFSQVWYLRMCKSKFLKGLHYTGYKQLIFLFLELLLEAIIIAILYLMTFLRTIYIFYQALKRLYKIFNFKV